MNDLIIPELKLPYLTSVPENSPGYPIYKAKELIVKTYKEFYNKFIVLGYALQEYKKEFILYHKSFGEAGAFQSIESQFGIKETSAKNLISVYQRFSNGETDPKKIKMQPKYENYSFSKLVELLPVKDSDLSKFYDYYTVKEIREKKERLYPKAVEEKTIPAEVKEKGQTSDLNKIIINREEVPLIVVEADPVKENDNTIKFKNNEERDAFLKAFEKWSLWLDIPALNLKIYRVTLSNKSVILAYGYNYQYGKNTHKSVVYKYFEDVCNIHFNSCFDNMGSIVDYIRTNKLSAMF